MIPTNNSGISKEISPLESKALKEAAIKSSKMVVKKIDHEIGVLKSALKKETPSFFQSLKGRFKKVDKEILTKENGENDGGGSLKEDKPQSKIDKLAGEIKGLEKEKKHIKDIQKSLRKEKDSKKLMPQLILTLGILTSSPIGTADIRAIPKKLDNLEHNLNTTHLENALLQESRTKLNEKAKERVKIITAPLNLTYQENLPSAFHNIRKSIEVSDELDKLIAINSTISNAITLFSDASDLEQLLDLQKTEEWNSTTSSKPLLNYEVRLASNIKNIREKINDVTEIMKSLESEVSPSLDQAKKLEKSLEHLSFYISQHLYSRAPRRGLKIIVGIYPCFVPPELHAWASIGLFLRNKQKF